jgi:uncharacterized membrane protein
MFPMPLSLVLLLIKTIIARHDHGAPLLITASVMWAAIIALTLLFLVPIHNKMIRLLDSLSDEARRKHKKWDALHRFRIAALVVSMICFVIGGAGTLAR